MLRLSIRSREKPDVRARRVLVTPPGGHRHRRHRPLGLSKREGLAAARLYYWRKRLNAANSKDPVLPGGRFLAVQLPQRNEDSGCQLCIGTGVQLNFPQLPSPHWLAALCLALTTLRTLTR